MFPLSYVILLSIVNPLDHLIEVLQVKKDWQSCRRCFKLPQKWHLIGYFSKFATTSMFSLVSQPHFEVSVRMKLALPKSGNLESSETPENSELDCRGQNTLP
jgi:hypothetical protein